MQPYFFPYIGYFDDVNFIKRGWINRNRILINGKPSYFTVQLNKASQNYLINEITINDNRSKLKKSVELSYKKAPQFNDVWPIIEFCMNVEIESVSELAMVSVKEVCRYLDIKTELEISSELYPETKGMDRAERLLAICKKNNADTYINSIGGESLYSKEVFKKQGVKLLFIQSEKINYSQNIPEFLSNLSIIDVLMWNSKSVVKDYLTKYQLI